MVNKADKYYLQVRKMQAVGLRCGYKIFEEQMRTTYTVKLGCTTYIIGIPGHGKSEIHNEILMRLSERYNLKHFYWSPEGGSVVRQIADLMSKYKRKPFNDLKGTDFDEAFGFVNTYFHFLDFPTDELLDATAFFDLAQKAITLENLNTVSIDPWNELYHNFTPFSGREDMYLSFVLGKIRKFSEDNNIHAFIIVHPRTQYEKAAKGGGYKPINIYELSGGAMWANKAQSILSIFREDFGTNEAALIFQKVKPKEV